MDLFSNYPRVFTLFIRNCSSGKRAAGNGSSWPGLTFIDCPVEPNPIVISQVFRLAIRVVSCPEPAVIPLIGVTPVCISIHCLSDYDLKEGENGALWKGADDS